MGGRDPEPPADLEKRNTSEGEGGWLAGDSSTRETHVGVCLLDNPFFFGGGAWYNSQGVPKDSKFSYPRYHYHHRTTLLTGVVTADRPLYTLAIGKQQ